MGGAQRNPWRRDFHLRIRPGGAAEFHPSGFFNLKDFLDETLAPHACSAAHPDDFLLDLVGRLPEQASEAVRAILRRLRNPPMGFDEYLYVLCRVGLPKTAGRS